MWGKWKELFLLEISYFQKGSPDRNLILPGGINFVFSKHSCNKYFITPNIIWYYTIHRVLNISFLLSFNYLYWFKSKLFICTITKKVYNIITWILPQFSYAHVGFFIPLKLKIARFPKSWNMMCIPQETPRFDHRVTWLSKPIRHIIYNYHNSWYLYFIKRSIKSRNCPTLCYDWILW